MQQTDLGYLELTFYTDGFFTPVKGAAEDDRQQVGTK